MKFLNYKLTLVAVLAIFLASCAGDGKDKTKEPVAQAFTPVGTVWESQPKKQGYLLPYRQQKIEFKTADTLIFSFQKVNNCFGKKDYANVVKIKYTYDASKKEVKLADKVTAISGTSDGVNCKSMNKELSLSKVFDTNIIKNLDANSTKIELITKLLTPGQGGYLANEKELIKQ